MTGQLAGLQVTVVGIYYAPDSTGIAPYTTDLCETLAVHGASVHAIVGVPHYPQWRVDRGYATGRRREETRNGVRVTRVRHFVPRQQDVLRRGMYELTFGVGAVAASTRDRPELVLGVTPNLAGAVAAARLARRRNVPLGIVVQDLLGLGARQSGIRGGAGVADRIAHAEAAVLRRADRVAVISDAFRKPLLDGGLDPARVDLVPNYARVTPATVDRDAARRLLGWPTDRPIALHSGNMGLKQGLHSVVDAARLADRRGSDVCFVLLGDGSTRRSLEQHADGVSSIRFIDTLTDDDFPLALSAADCLLLNERPSVRDMSMPSKLTSYFAAGRPVAAATHATSTAANAVRRSGAGLLVAPGDPAALLSTVERFVREPELAAQLGAAGRSYAERVLSRDGGRRVALDFVASVARLRPPVMS